MVCLFFTEYCNRHELHRELEWEAVNPLDLLPGKEAVDVDLDGGNSSQDGGDSSDDGEERDARMRVDANGGSGSGSGVLMDGPLGIVAGKRVVDMDNSSLSSQGNGNGSGSGVVHWHEQATPTGSSGSSNNSSKFGRWASLGQQH